VPLDRPAGLRQVYEGVQDRTLDDPVAPPGYAFVRWGTVAPEQYAGAVSVLETTLGAGTPEAGADATYARRFETMRVGRGRRAFHTGVVHLSSGLLVGYTSISMTSTQPTHALQGMTVVHEHHRGRGLGLLLKKSNLHHVRSLETRLDVVETTNDETNTAMVAVNAALGYVPVERRVHLGATA
jgi:GNAT superfamily N-acetyltransferase